jgi:hypothetical protein
MLNTKCEVCDDAGWVCEDHLDKGWAGTSTRADACDCGGAGVPCGRCNTESPPAKTGMVRVIFDKDGFRH